LFFIIHSNIQKNNLGLLISVIKQGGAPMDYPLPDVIKQKV